MTPRRRPLVAAAAAFLVVGLAGCSSVRDEQIREVGASGFDTKCSALGGTYVEPTWPAAELPARCMFDFPDLPGDAR